MINFFLDGKNIIVKEDIYIGMVMVLLFGNLIVFVVWNVDKKLLVELVLVINDLVIKVWDGKFIVDEMKGSIFIISNVGIFGSLMGMLIIN